MLTVLLWLVPALAAPDPTRVEAKKHYLAGQKHFDLQEYTEALAEFKEAYRLLDDPVFLYNIGQCYKLLNNTEEALRAYKTYLSRAPEAPNRADVERKIAALEEKRAAEQRAADEAAAAAKRAEAPPPAPVVTPTPAPVLVASAPPPRTPVYKKWWLWTTVGVVAAGVGLGVGLGLGLNQSKGEPLFPNVSF
jgi:iron complex outermembrane receptor protein